MIKKYDINDFLSGETKYFTMKILGILKQLNDNRYAFYYCDDKLYKKLGMNFYGDRVNSEDSLFIYMTVDDGISSDYVGELCRISVSIDIGGIFGRQIFHGIKKIS